jgi:hypothetical protein
MKAPAVRVLRVRIQEKAQEQIRAAQTLAAPLVDQYQKDFAAHREEFQRRVTEEVNKHIKKYVIYSHSNGRGQQFVGLPAFDEFVQQLREKFPEPKAPPSTKQVGAQIASLDMHLGILESKTKEWTKFILAVDNAFLNDDAQGILEALELL